MRGFNFTPFPVLKTENLILRQIKTDDENEFYILKSDKRILKYLGYRAKTFDEARQFLKKINEEISKNVWILWGITLKSEDKLIGSICFWNISSDYSKAEVGYELMPDYQGKGIMQESMMAVINYGFNNMKLKTIEAFPNPENLRSVRLLERNNFIRGASFNHDNFEQVTYTLENKII